MRIDPPEPYEPQVEPPPFLHPSHKAQIDEDYMSFSVVWQRIWPLYLQRPLEAFCREKGPHIFHKKLLFAEVQKLMVQWCMEAEVKNWDQSMQPLQPEFQGWDRGQIEQMWQSKDVYEQHVRRWHTKRHIVMYAYWSAGELRKMGYKIGI